MRSAIYEGVVSHRRYGNAETNHVSHEFTQRLSLPLVFLDEVNLVTGLHPLWSIGRRNVAWMRRQDYLGDPDVSLEVAVRDEAERALGWRPGGPIAVLGHFRTWGKVSNPLCLFYCYESAGGRVEAIVAQVTNTPWGERHAYVIDTKSLSARMAKAMHVSPLMGMEQEYVFAWSEPGATLCFQVGNRVGGTRVHDASLKLDRRPIDRRELSRLLWRRGLDNYFVTLGIYVRALGLWFRGAKFHSHPEAPPRRSETSKVGVTSD